jgi:hypothetical protein
MTEYRIIQVDYHDRTIYKIQRKGWFDNWRGVTCWHPDFDINLELTFKTMEEAEEWVLRGKKPVQTIVMHITVEEE